MNSRILKRIIGAILMMSLFIGIIAVQPASAKTTVKLSKKSVTLAPEAKYQLSVIGAPGDSTIKWTSSKKSVATVKNGIVTAKKAGKSTITATVNGTKIKCKVKVTKPAQASFKADVKVKTFATNADYFKALCELIKTSDAGIKKSSKDITELHTNRIVVGGTPDVSGLDPNSVTVLVSPFGEYVFQFKDTPTAQAFLRLQDKNTKATYAEEDTYVSVNTIHTTEIRTKESLNSWGTDFIEAPELAKKITEAKLQREVLVAVVDTGVDYTVPFLAGRIHSHGIDIYDGDDDAFDGVNGNGHGTHVSGTIVDCTPGLSVKILPVRVLGTNGSGSSLQVASGVRAAVSAGAEVINLSLGGGTCQTLDAAVRDAVQAGVVVVCAAGNESDDSDYYSPSRVHEAIIVSALDDDGRSLAYFSNYGNGIDITCPGVSIRSCVPGGTFEIWAGTSMAAPHCSAAAAMCKMIARTATPAEVEKMLKDHTLDLGASGIDDLFGAGVIKLADMLDDEAVALTVTRNPNKVLYTVGEALDTTGIVVELTYSSGKKEVVSDGLSFTPRILQNEGTQEIIVSHGKLSTSFTVTVKKAEATALEFISLPLKTEYFDGEFLDTTGMRLRIVYANGETKEITTGFSCTPTYLSLSNLNILGYMEKRKIEVRYENLTAEFEILLKSVAVKGLSIEKNAAKPVYKVGESINPGDISLRVFFTNDRSEVVYDSFTITPSVFTLPGDQIVSVAYAGLTTEFTVKVDAGQKNEITHIVIDKMPDKRTYTVGDTLDTGGIVVSAVYADGTKERITEGLTFAPTRLEKDGIQDIMVIYKDPELVAVFSVAVQKKQNDTPSGWIPLEQLPAGATIIDQKWLYDYTERTESFEKSMPGWTQNGSDWKEVANHASFPGTFDQNHELYKTFLKAPVDEFVTDDAKRVVKANRFKGYVYWHFMYNVAYHVTTERAISDRYGSWDVYGNNTTSGFWYGYFSAFTSSVDCPYLDNYYCCSRNQPSYDCRNVIPESIKANLGAGTPRYFRFSYYECEYTDYKKLYKYSRTTQKESFEEVFPSDSISNITVWVRYTY